MSTECDRIADQLYRSVEGEPWHGPPLGALLADVTAEEAAAHPIPGAHSIWELVIHLAVWTDVVRRRVGGELVDPTPAEDWPPVRDVSAAAWSDAKEVLERAYADIRRTVLALGDGHLDDRTPGKSDTLYASLQGLVQHAAYHGGQVAVLKRAAGASR